MDKGLPAHPGVNLECLLEIFEVSTRKMQTFSDLLEGCSLAKYYYFKFSLEHQNVRTERDHRDHLVKGPHSSDEETQRPEKICRRPGQETHSRLENKHLSFSLT